MAAPSCLAVAGHRSGEVAEELVDHTVVAGRHHQMKSTLLSVEAPPPVVHDVADGVHVDGVGAELEQRQVGVEGDPQPQPRPMKGILVAMIVINCTLTSIGRLAM